MLHMVIVRHTPESCPGRPGNESIHPCMHSMDELLKERGVRTVGRWAEPAAHVNYFVWDAENAHVIQSLFMESGMFAHVTAEIHPVVSMDE